VHIGGRGPSLNKAPALFTGYGPWAFVANLVAFATFAFWAFSRNVNGLFFSFDGTDRLVDVSNQLATSRPLLEFSNHTLTQAARPPMALSESTVRFMRFGYHSPASLK
jgi:hypothetical protein